MVSAALGVERPRGQANYSAHRPDSGFAASSKRSARPSRPSTEPEGLHSVSDRSPRQSVFVGASRRPPLASMLTSNVVWRPLHSCEALWSAGSYRVCSVAPPNCALHCNYCFLPSSYSTFDVSPTLPTVSSRKYTMIAPPPPPPTFCLRCDSGIRKGVGGGSRWRWVLNQ